MIKQSNEGHEIQRFRNAGFPEKCVRCYRLGLRFCRFWLHDNDCESWEQPRLQEVVAESLEIVP